MTGMDKRWTAIVLAGQRPGIDPLADHFGVRLKALVQVGGEAMLARVVDTLAQVPDIARTVVLAQDAAAIAQALGNRHEITIATSNAGISSSIRSIAGTETAPWPVLITTADHPLLTPTMIAEFLDGARGCDLAVGMVERSVMLARYPENRRTWLKFSDGHWSGANLFALNGPAVRAALDLWADAEQDRKTAWKLFLHFGPWLALRALTRTIGLGVALARAGRRLGLSARLVPLSQAEAAIDVDKPSDHTLAEDILAHRISQP